MIDLQALKNGPKATLPNNTKIQAPLQVKLPLHSEVSPKAIVYPNLNNKSLLSIGKLCNEGCIAVFDKKTLCIKKWKNNPFG